MVVEIECGNGTDDVNNSWVLVDTIQHESMGPTQEVETTPER